MKLVRSEESQIRTAHRKISYDSLPIELTLIVREL